MSKVATTPTKKYFFAECSNCIHFEELKNNLVRCNNPEMEVYYGNKIKKEKLNVCDLYEI